MQIKLVEVYKSWEIEVLVDPDFNEAKLKATIDRLHALIDEMPYLEEVEIESIERNPNVPIINISENELRKLMQSRHAPVFRLSRGPRVKEYSLVGFADFAIFMTPTKGRRFK